MIKSTSPIRGARRFIGLLIGVGAVSLGVWVVGRLLRGGLRHDASLRTTRRGSEYVRCRFGVAYRASSMHLTRGQR